MKPATASAVDAVEESDDATSPPSIGKAEALIESLGAAKWRRYPPTGLGTDFRLQYSRVIAAALAVDGIAVNASDFLLSAGQTRRPETGMAPLCRRRRLHMH